MRKFDMLSLTAKADKLYSHHQLLLRDLAAVRLETPETLITIAVEGHTTEVAVEWQGKHPCENPVEEPTQTHGPPPTFRK